MVSLSHHDCYPPLVPSIPQPAPRAPVQCPHMDPRKITPRKSACDWSISRLLSHSLHRAFGRRRTRVIVVRLFTLLPYPSLLALNLGC